VVARAVDRFGLAPPLRLLVARRHIERGEWSEAEAVLAPVVGAADRARACAAWSWIAVARGGDGDLQGASDAARAALAIDGHDTVALYALGRARR
jgi:predicted Zn-dependent protease